jgi:non-ribosomal peptide synthetase component F
VVLQAAFKTLLYLHSGSTDISIGTPAANRGNCGLDNLVGCFINMLVLRSDLSGNPTFEGLIEREQERCYGAYLHQEVPFQTVVADIRPKRVPGVTPLFQMAFSLRAPTAMNLSGTGLRGERIPLHNGTAKYELSVEVIGLDNGELELRSEFSNDRFDSSAITEMLKSYEELLKGIAMDPRRHLDDLRL